MIRPINEGDYKCLRCESYDSRLGCSVSYYSGVPMCDRDLIISQDYYMELLRNQKHSIKDRVMKFVDLLKRLLED